MGLITLTGDSDGDLHTAALHNAKFGAIASVLNGNVDHANLASLTLWGILISFAMGPALIISFMTLAQPARLEQLQPMQQTLPLEDAMCLRRLG